VDESFSLISSINVVLKSPFFGLVSFTSSSSSYSSSSRYSSAVLMARATWKGLLESSLRDCPTVTILDLTCGNGHDTLELASLLRNHNQSNKSATADSGSRISTLFACDIQSLALENTKQRLLNHGFVVNVAKSEEARPAQNAINPFIKLSLGDHATIDMSDVSKADLVVFNLGWLPRSDKLVRTQSHSTLATIQRFVSSSASTSSPRLSENGLLSIVLYPGHPEGAIEKRDILEFVSDENLPRSEWYVSHYVFDPSPDATTPSLLLLRRRGTT